MIYLDTSVLVSLYLREPLTDVAYASIAEREVFVSWLNEVEFASALSRRCREGSMTAVEAERVLRVFQDHLDAGRFARVEVKADAFEAAKLFFRNFSVPLRSLDAIQVGIATIAGAEMHTADQQLARAMTTLRLKVKLLKPRTGKNGHR